MSFKLDILTPSKVVVRDLECDDLLIPTTRGQINVLSDHTHVVTKLDTGHMTVKTKDGSTRAFSITAGVCKVLKDKVTLLSTVTEEAHQIDLQRAEKAKSLAEGKLAGKDTLSDNDRVKYERKLARAKARMELYRFFIKK